MTTLSLAKLRAAADAMPFATLRDDYTDRYGCRSVALALCMPWLRDLMRLGAALAAHGCGDLLDHWPHLDEMGLGIVVAWPRFIFDDADMPDAEEG